MTTFTAKHAMLERLCGKPDRLRHGAFGQCVSSSVACWLGSGGRVGFDMRRRHDHHGTEIADTSTSIVGGNGDQWPILRSCVAWRLLDIWGGGQNDDGVGIAVGAGTCTDNG